MSELDLIKKENLRLKNSIKNNIFGKENAFLVKEDFYNRLINSQPAVRYRISSAELKDILINNDSSLVNNLKKNISFRLISVKILQTIFSDKNLNNFNHSFYGYNKVIIEFSGGKEGVRILLIEDPFNSNNNYKAISLIIKDKKEQMENLYKKLLVNKINDYEDYIKKSESKLLPSKTLNKLNQSKSYINIEPPFGKFKATNKNKCVVNEAKDNKYIKLKNGSTKDRGKKIEIIKKAYIKEEKPNNKSFVIIKEKEKNIEANNILKNNNHLLDEIKKLKEDNIKKDDEIKKLREEILKQKNDEFIASNKLNKLKKELNEANIQLDQLRKENEKLKNLINAKEQKKILKEVKESNKILINQIDNLNQKENKNKNYIKIIYKKEDQKIIQDNDKLVNTMDYLEKHGLIKKNYNNQNINLNLTKYNEEYSNLDISYNLYSPLNKTYQIPNIEDENAKKIGYLNIILKCLSQILKKYFLKGENIIRNNIQMQLSNEFLKYVQKERNASSILIIIENIDKNLKYNYNLQNIISIIFDQLHKELKKIKELKKEKEPININKFPLNNREKDAFDNLLEMFVKEVTIISELFTGFIEKNIICPVSNINLSTYKFNTYNYLLFPIQKYKNKYNITNKGIELNKCFIYYIKDGSFTEKEKSECEICNEMCQKTFYSYFFSNPNFLILILDKGNENFNEDIKVKFEEKLTLKSKLSEDNYYLYAVITQIGIDRQNIVASYKTNNDNNWYRYSNGIEKPIKDVQKEVIDFEHPLLLFYKNLKHI